MSAQITIHVAGDERSVDAGDDCGRALRRRPRGRRRYGSTVSCATSAHVLADGAVVEPVRIDEPDGLMVLRHSCAHVLAQAVQQVNPDAKLGIGPPIRDGFYYDFDVAEPFTPEDLKNLEKVMQRIINEGQTFHRREVVADERGPASSWPPSPTSASSSGSRAAPPRTPPRARQRRGRRAAS
jgi:threonyl-tRNA synthetase